MLTFTYGLEVGKESHLGLLHVLYDSNDHIEGLH